MYGSLLYTLMGEKAQESYTRGWLLGLATSQLAQFKSLLITGLQGAAVVLVLELLWVVGNKTWLMDHIGACLLLLAYSRCTSGVALAHRRRAAQTS